MTKRSFLFFALFFVAFAAGRSLLGDLQGGRAAPPRPRRSRRPTSPAKDLFATNCGSCHTLARAGTDGVVGPNLDDLLGGIPGQQDRVLTAIQMGVQGRMPAGILQGAAGRAGRGFRRPRSRPVA